MITALHQYQSHEISAKAIFYKNLSENEFKNFDILVFQRLGANQGIIALEDQKRLFQWMNDYRDQKVYVYDIDDYVFEEQNGFPILMLKQCHWALAPNEYLQKKMMEYQPQTHIIRTHIDLQGAESCPKVDLPLGMIYIGWFSIGAHGINIIEAIYPKLFQKWKGKILIHAYVEATFKSSLEERFDSSLVKVHSRIPLKEMYSLEKSFDILINPLDECEVLSHYPNKNQKEREDFLDCKSEIKYLHAGAARKPLIVSPTGPFRKAVTHGVTGYLAKTPEEWLICLENLLTQPKMRETIGRNAYKHICEEYTYCQTAEKYLHFFKRIYNATLPTQL